MFGTCWERRSYLCDANCELFLLRFRLTNGSSRHLAESGVDSRLDARMGSRPPTQSLQHSYCFLLSFTLFRMSAAPTSRYDSRPTVPRFHGSSFSVSLSLMNACWITPPALLVLASSSAMKLLFVTASSHPAAFDFSQISYSPHSNTGWKMIESSEIWSMLHLFQRFHQHRGFISDSLLVVRSAVVPGRLPR